MTHLLERIDMSWSRWLEMFSTKLFHLWAEKSQAASRRAATQSDGEDADAAGHAEQTTLAPCVASLNCVNAPRAESDVTSCGAVNRGRSTMAARPFDDNGEMAGDSAVERCPLAEGAISSVSSSFMKSTL
jgi:hypothetical protein